MLQMNITDKVALVTGAGRGIGRVIALKLAKMGMKIAVNDVGNPAPPEAVVNEIKAMCIPATFILADVSSPTEVTRLVSETVATYGRLDVLVNNAGITRDNLLMRMSEDEWDRVLTVDLKSVFLCTKEAVKHMVKQRSGRIISMASIVGIVGNPGQANYAAAKAGIIGFTRAIAKEVASRGITVNAVAPGFIDTDMTKALKDDWKEELKKRIPLGSFGSPQDVADAVGFLASEEARYITGQILAVDGGMTISGF
jgi:3-oxoacyl-[acyl-carrier protein] reductase